MADAVGILIAGVPAEIAREIGLRLSGVTVTEFDNVQQMARAAARGESRVVILSDTLPTQDSIYIARRAKDSSDDVRVVYCVSMTQAEPTLRALKDVEIDRFFFSPVDVGEMLRELGKMCGVAVLAPHDSHGDHIAAAVFAAWDRAKPLAFQQVDKLDDAAIALLDNSLSAELKAAAEAAAQSLVTLATRFGFPKASSVAREIADRFSAPVLTAVEGVAISEQLLALRQHLSGPPQPPAAKDASRDADSLTADSQAAAETSQLEGTRVLVVDDEPMISRGLASVLGKRGIAVTTLNDPMTFWSVLDESKPNLVLLDLEMPRISGIELCRVIRSDRRWSELPLIFLSGHTDQESVHRMFAAGADDYVGKPFVPAELIMRIESRLTGAKQRRGPVETDPVTGLPTAPRATDLIQRFLRLARRKSDPYSIAVLEVDNFTMLTQDHGRRMGEIVLRAIGDLLPQSFRGEDVVGWWGGAEFTIGMYGSPKEQSAAKLSQICAKIAAQSFLTDGGETVRVSCSAGISQYQVDGDDVPILRDEALKILRLVRQSGVNKVGIAGARPSGPMTRRVDIAIVEQDAALVALLRHAMESRSLSVAAFADGESAVAALTSDPPDVWATVILLDVDLPALNGLEVLRRCKAVNVTRGSSVVMLTARTGERDVLTALELGAVDHITKPFSVPVLMHKVRTVLRQNQPW